MKTFIAERWELSEPTLTGDVIVRHADDTFHTLRIEEKLRKEHWAGVDAQMNKVGLPVPSWIETYQPKE